MPKLKQLAHNYKIELVLVGLSFLFGGVMLWWVNSLHLVKALTDQNAHLNAARLAFDSMTPGISQIGFWPPLLHILMMPFTLINSLYTTGFAGAIVLVPCLALAAIFLYRLCLLYTNDRFLSFIAALLLIVNPYVLYYAVTPMMEILFVANLFGTVYFLAMWLRYDKLSYLLATGIFITLTCLSRYEGLILIPLVSLIVLFQLYLKGKKYSQIEAIMLLFLIPSLIGLCAIMVYSWIFSGSPLTFTGGSWIRNPPVATFPTKGNIIGSLNYMLHASYYMLTQPLVILAIISFVIFFFLSSKKFHSIAVLSVLFSPFIFIATTLYTGTGSIAVANLPPYNFFSNERYSLTWIGFTIVTPILLIGALYYYFGRSDRRWMSIIGLTLRNSLAIILLGLGLYQLYSVTIVQKFEVIRENINSPLSSQDQVTAYLQQNYDYGKILITKADNDPILAQAGVPLDDYIYEGNYKYFDQSNQEPWVFARFVIMHNPGDNDAWSQQNEAVMDKWGNSAQFNSMYTLVLQNSQRRVYKINDQAVLTMAKAEGLNPNQIPSINRDITWWNPSTIYSQLAQVNSVSVNSSVKKN